jgi:hypothetical protein
MSQNGNMYCPAATLPLRKEAVLVGKLGPVALVVGNHHVGEKGRDEHPDRRQQDRQPQFRNADIHDTALLALM